MNKKIILITGATQGIGKETAKTLAIAGHYIVLHGRNEAKLKMVANDIKAISQNPNIDYLVADLFSLADTRRMTDEFKKRYDRLDVLINNAGAIMNKNRELTTEGLEKTMALNLFAPFLLMHLLLEPLQKSESGRIVNLSSAMHRRGGKPDLSDVQLEKSYSTDRAYGLSKLYLIWITQQMSSYLKTNGIHNVTVNATHPGAVATNFGQDSDKGCIMNLIFKAALLVMDKVEDGARSTLFLAISEEVQNTTGKFFSNKSKPENPSTKYYSPENEKLIWDYCLKITERYNL